MDKYSIHDMLALHEQRYPYGHDEKAIRKNLVDFERADEDFTPVCLKGKHWELIKLDFVERLAQFN